MTIILYQGLCCGRYKLHKNIGLPVGTASDPDDVVETYGSVVAMLLPVIAHSVV